MDEPKSPYILVRVDEENDITLLAFDGRPVWHPDKEVILETKRTVEQKLHVKLQIAKLTLINN